jgi:hypothetical protein
VFDYSRIQVELELLDDHAPSGYWGTKLRGGFGTALKVVLCDHPEFDKCVACPRFCECDYPLLFKPQRSALKEPPIGQPLGKQENLPPPFVLNPPPMSINERNRGDRLTFELIIFGPVKEKLRVLLDTFAEFGKRGIEHGRRSARFKVIAIRDILQEKKLIVAHHSSEEINLGLEFQNQIKSESILQTIERTRPEALPSSLAIHFITPVRVERANPRRRDPVSGLAIFSDCYDFVFDLSERVAGIWQLYGSDWRGQTEFFRWQDKLKKASRQIVWVEDSLNIERRERFSTTQNKKLTVDGFTGEVKLTGDFTQLWDLFRIGEIIHAGQLTSFGFGRYLML